MKKTLTALCAILIAAPATANVPPAQPRPTLENQADMALANDGVAWDFVEGITTEVGQRQAGTEAEARGRAWAVQWLRANGFANVADEPYMMSTWVPGEPGRAEIVSPFPQSLAVAPLGDTASTGPEGITAEVVMFRNVAELVAAPEGSLKGKIAFVSNTMTPTQDGSQYGFAGPTRWVAAGIAAQKGALATVIKSVGTDDHRNPHTGGTTFPEGVTPTPAGALSNPDAANLERMFARAKGKPITMKLVLTPRFLGETQSGNVVGEIVGRNPSLPPVLLACHLDSWWLGTGAIDDGAGCAIIAAAASRVAKAGQPLRTIRVLFAGAEETGLWGSKAYSAAHIDEPIAVGLESDFGADRIWRFDSNFRETNPALHKKIAAAVARFGVSSGNDVATGGADINIVRDQKGALIDLQQDGTRYFDLHHTPDDTLDKIDIVQLRQNVAVWTQVVGILANEPAPILTGAPSPSAPPIM
ncbi:M20/M25/M40 family metallo-hydrolase [Porphyrobacter sp. YT40]|uniref:M20/M25/M40 family metallo-hydrolase n=1 Tax=Porphyrobacter sp. YT40 TaxID=2547601 RepID=UPI001142246F|nr:M20/M25/M40 family metallo-hydrolase [Porphyrobacter sp. YT40]QDH35374.1 M20/M25/M40 family metallo-hydrolase [Porphyrobacter sp. YT40]